MKVLALLFTGLTAAGLARADESPRVEVKNGTLVGVHNSQYNQDYFLGIPYGQPPVGPLRFRNPASYNESWAEEREAKALAPACYGYGTSQWGYPLSEDCLYLNVYRPANIPKDRPLPVLIWIFGGAFVQGSGSDLRYNMTFMVNRSLEINQPIIAVNLNYRLSAWGFLGGSEVATAGDSNFGLRDQRLALQWVHENIAAFGGDPDKVTIWGQSAGAMSVNRHLLAFNGRDDKLFRSAALNSGAAISNDQPLSALQPKYDQLVQRAGCSSEPDTLSCLRSLTTETLNAAINTTSLLSWGPSLDGDFIARPSRDQFRDGAFLHIPILTGTNTDEASGITPPSGINTTSQFRASLSPKIPENLKDEILRLYPEDIQPNALPNLPADYTPPAFPYGLQYFRTATYNTDSVMVSNRRAMCQKWADIGLTAWCYTFNAIPAWSGPLDGSAHFAEVAFAQYNLLGTGYAPIRKPPFQGLGEEFKDLSRLMSADYIAFVNSGDPNLWEGRRGVAKTLGGERGVPRWPKYTKGGVGAKCRGEPKVFKYDANITSSVVKDDWRKEGMELLQKIAFL